MKPLPGLFLTALLLLLPACCHDTGTQNSKPGDERAGPETPPPADPARASAGCGAPHTGGDLPRQTLTVGQTQRTYLLVLPTSYDPNQPLPVVFAWHGNRWTGEQFRNRRSDYTSDVEGAAGGQAIFVYPDGLPIDDLSPALRGGESLTGSGWDWRLNGRDIEFFDTLLAHLRATYCVDPARVYSFGQSHGGYFTHALACARGNVLRAAASTSAGLPPTVTPGACQGNVPVWMAHNERDPDVELKRGLEARDFWLGQHDCTPTATEPFGADPCVLYTQCTTARPVVWCQTGAQEHKPPRFSGASIWSFFSSNAP